MRVASLFVAAAVLLAQGSAAAATIHVPADQPTIQAGIDAALFYGDVVEVADGTYTGPGNRDLILDKHITVRSASGDPSHCVIDAQGAGRGFAVSGVVSAARAEGSPSPGAPAGWGGGMSCDNASPTVVNCRFVANAANVVGGGALSLENGSSPTVTGCVFAGNTTNGYDGGAAVWNAGGAPAFLNCTFSGNHTSGIGVVGGAMRNMGGGDPVLTNCTLSANNAYDATALYSDGTGTVTTLINCVIWGHPPGTSGVVIQTHSNAATVITYSDVQGGFVGTGNVSGNPGFLDPDGPDGVVGTADDDVRLSRFSPAADAGNNAAPGLSGVTVDQGGFTRFRNDVNVADTGNGTAPIVDMGGWERQENSVAQTVHVPADAATIQAAIDVAQLGDQVVLADGTYSGDGNRDLLVTQAVTIRSASGQPSACVIDAGSASRVITFRGASAASVLEGVTVTGGSAGDGGGILVDGGSATVRGCRITANHATGNGGGGLCIQAGAAPRIADCTLTANTTGGVGVVGGAIYVTGGSTPTVINCTLWNNTAYDASAVFSTGGGTSTALINSIVWGNAAGTSGNRIQGVAGAANAVSYSDVEGGFAGTGNISQNPVFADADLRLAPISPCIDAGSNPPVLETEDYDGRQRIFDGNGDMTATVDLGPFEYGAPLQTGIGEGTLPVIPLRAWPNPARGLHHLRYTLDASAPVTLQVYDASGRRVRTIENGVQGAGSHEASWDGRDEEGRPVAPGLYILRLASGDEAQAIKLLRVR
jgi:hypothetical protein